METNLYAKSRILKRIPKSQSQYRISREYQGLWNLLPTPRSDSEAAGIVTKQENFQK